MAQVDSIDFLRDDFGGNWLLPVMFGIAIGLGVFKNYTIKNFKQDGWRGSFKKFLSGFIVGVIFALPIVVFILVWQRWPPQYFIRLHVEKDRLVLGQHWPTSDVVVPYTDIVSLEKIVERPHSYRWKTRRIVIYTKTGIHQSFGYSNSTEEEQRVWEKLMSLVQENSNKENIRNDQRKSD